VTNIAAKTMPIIPTAIANPRDPYVACPLDLPVAVLVELLPVAEAPPALVVVPADPVCAEFPPKVKNRV
jgi:hypothetical protein